MRFLTLYLHLDFTKWISSFLSFIKSHLTLSFVCYCKHFANSVSIDEHTKSLFTFPTEQKIIDEFFQDVNKCHISHILFVKYNDNPFYLDLIVKNRVSLSSSGLRDKYHLKRKLAGGLKYIDIDLSGHELYRVNREIYII